ETYEPDATVSIVARRYGIQPNQLFTWRKLANQGALTATAAEEDVVPASEYRALQNQVKELQRLLGKKTMEGEILKEALEIAAGPTSTSCARCRCRREVSDDGGMRGFRCRPIKYGATGEAASFQSPWTSSARGR